MNAARTLLRLAPLLALVACASGPPFAPVPAQPPEKAIVYVYRNARFFGDAVVYTVNAGGVPLVKLQPGGYIALVAEPRETEFSARTEATTSITLDLEPGETYYLKGGVGVGFLIGRPQLTLVDDVVGASEIQKCKKLGPASLGLATP
jgi:hypothetical protein